MIRAGLIFLLALLPLLTSAQFSVSFNSGIGTYEMSDLKALQESVRLTMPVNPRVIASFPAYYFYELTATHELKTRHVLGATFSYGSTGGRLYYSDYSGSLWFDQLASYYSITSLFGKRFPLLKGKLIFQADVRPGVTFTKLNISINEILGTASDSENHDFHSANLTIQPSVSFQYHWRAMTLNAFAGYNLNLVNSELTSSENGGSVLTKGSSGTTASANWSGIRAGGGIGFNIKSNSAVAWDNVLIAFGLGLDYGGIGVNLMAYPQKNVGVFIGTGYALAGLGFNSGLKFRMANSNSKINPFLIGMYGYNAAIAVSGHGSLDKLFYGPSLGVGIDRTGRHKSRGWSFAVLVPIRGAEADSYMNALKSAGASFANTLQPVAISVGYRMSTAREN